MTEYTCTQCGYVGNDGDTMCTRCGTPYPVLEGDGEAPPIRKGQVIANRYAVLDMIGRGGMGCIYKVQDNTLGEIVALKTLLPEYTREKTVVERFFNEARIARGLSHPHIVRVHDIGSADGIIYISMELLQGRTLRSMLEKVEPGRRIPLNAILRMFDALCAALEYAHNVTIHRDIKPENVMVLPNGTVKLMDFGISKLKSNPNLTSASMVMGTPHYMSPEQLKNSANVDGRADIYSVGIMLYEALTGDIPTGIARGKDTIKEVPRALDPVIAKCCHPQADKRYQTVTELRETLRNIRVDIETQSGKIDTPRSSSATASPTNSRLGQKALVILVITALGTGTFFAINIAEDRRNDMLKNTPRITISVSDDQLAPGKSEKALETFEGLKTLIEVAKPLANTVLLNSTGTPYHGQMTKLMNDADERWNTAMNAGVDDRNGLDMGWPILQRYLAIMNWQEGMLFIQEGVRGGFFIDNREVSANEFLRFSSVNWRPAPGSQSGQDAAVNVTYYDALAFLNSSEQEKKLPTKSQWEQAAKSIVTEPPEDGEIPLQMTGQVYEWIRSTKQSRTAKELFGEPMSFITWNYSQIRMTAIGVKSMPYEGFAENVGFRGVLELPKTLDEARAWMTPEN